MRVASTMGMSKQNWPIDVARPVFGFRLSGDRRPTDRSARRTRTIVPRGHPPPQRARRLPQPDPAPDTGRANAELPRTRSRAGSASSQPPVCARRLQNLVACTPADSVMLMHRRRCRYQATRITVPRCAEAFSILQAAMAPPSAWRRQQWQNGDNRHTKHALHHVD